jgi:hypothetical protein
LKAELISDLISKVVLSGDNSGRRAVKIGFLWGLWVVLRWIFRICFRILQSPWNTPKQKSHRIVQQIQEYLSLQGGEKAEVRRYKDGKIWIWSMNIHFPQWQNNCTIRIHWREIGKTYALSFGQNQEVIPMPHQYLELLHYSLGGDPLILEKLPQAIQWLHEQL